MNEDLSFQPKPMATLIIEVYADGRTTCAIGSNANLEKSKVGDILLTAIDAILPNLVAYGDSPPKPFAEA